jgi:hypothetical protein
MKEKFGTLRLHWKARGMQDVRLDLVTRTRVLSAAVPEDKSSDGTVATRIAQIVRAAEEESSRTCIACGASASLRGGEWMLTLCDEHAQQNEMGKDLEIWFPSEVPDAGQP